MTPYKDDIQKAVAVLAELEGGDNRNDLFSAPWKKVGTYCTQMKDTRGLLIHSNRLEGLPDHGNKNRAREAPGTVSLPLASRLDAVQCCASGTEH